MSAVVTLRLHPDAARNFDEKARAIAFSCCSGTSGDTATQGFSAGYPADS